MKGPYSWKSKNCNLRNWKASGLDQVHELCLFFSSLYEKILMVCNCIGKHPDEAHKWRMEGRIIFFSTKEDPKISKNYMIITCIPMTYNLINLVLTNKILNHVTNLRVLLHEMKG